MQAAQQKRGPTGGVVGVIVTRKLFVSCVLVHMGPSGGEIEQSTPSTSQMA